MYIVCRIERQVAADCHDDEVIYRVKHLHRYTMPKIQRSAATHTHKLTHIHTHYTYIRIYLA